MEKSGEKWRNTKLGLKNTHRDQSKWDEDGFKIQYVRMLCTFLYLVVQNMTKWKSLSEESGEKSKNEVEKSGEKSNAYA